MYFTTFSLTALSVLSAAFAAPILSARGGPSGTLTTPTAGTTWDNTGGFGLGHVVYQGVSQAYSNSQGVTHVETHHIDVFLEAEDGSGTTIYLAKGIAPKDLIVDEEFQIPIGYGQATGSYRLVIEETQYGETPGYPIPITFRAAAPLITITAGPTP